MAFLDPVRNLTPAQRRTFTACFLGWTLDAFDFFILTFCLDSVASTFHVSLPTVADSLFWTLCMRPVGALLFGYMAERYGRRPTLMVNIICFSVFELSSAFAPTFGIFLVTRALFGIAMGGEWGVGAALALETLPGESRGFFSGLLQEGYVTGNLLAAFVYGRVFPHLHGTGLLTNWRVMFLLGALPSLLVFYVRRSVGESPAWVAQHEGAAEPDTAEGAVGAAIELGAEVQAGRAVATKRESAARGGLFAQIGSNLGLFLLLVALMTAFASFSHGTQDLYPTFLKRDHGLSAAVTSWVAIAGNIGALIGGITCGALSQRLGRRRVIAVAAVLAIPVIPLWAWSHTAGMLAVGGFLMQFMVQGAWGVVPVHLNELSPGPVRAIFPGLAYQLGNLISSYNGHLQAWLAVQYAGGRLAPVLAGTVVVVGLVLAVLAMVGREARGVDMVRA